MLKTCVYVMFDGERSKIGIALNPRKRREALQSGNPKEITLAFVLMAETKLHAHRVEQEAHRLLAGERLAGEWFAVGWERAAKAVENAASTVSVPAEPVRPDRVVEPPSNAHEWATFGRTSYCRKCLQMEFGASRECRGFEGTIWAGYFEPGARVTVTA